MIHYLDEYSEYALFQYKEWMKDMKRKYKYGRITHYNLGEKVSIIQFIYKAIENKLQVCEIIGIIQKINNNNYDILKLNDDIVYKNIHYINLKKNI